MIRQTSRTRARVAWWALLATSPLFLCERWRDRKTPGRMAVVGGLMGLRGCTRAGLALAVAATGAAAAVLVPFILWSPAPVGVAPADGDR